ncbi:TPA: hypothetical protein ACF6GQ_004841 [Citrobacter freundii]|nr:hypothetical protein [Citrobacter freundii]HEE9984978.1 hypothetical protein [Citrobacter freundii]
MWRHECNIDVERDLMAYMVSRVGDPDSLLQEQRGYLRLNQQQATRIIELEKGERRYRNEIARLRHTLERNDWQDPTQTSAAIPRKLDPIL